MKVYLHNEDDLWIFFSPVPVKNWYKYGRDFYANRAFKYHECDYIVKFLRERIPVGKTVEWELD